MLIRLFTSPRFRAAVLIPLVFLAVGPTAGASWTWPTDPPHRIQSGFVAPLTPYSAGHRGIDLMASVGTQVFAPDDGVISFVGRVADRPVISISHGGGLVSTVEPVEATVALGDRVTRGQQVGMTAEGGHCADTCLHFGVRRYGYYVSPLNYLGGAQRAVLLPAL